MSSEITFEQFVQTAFVNGPLSTDEVVGFVLPIFEEVLSLHDNGLVAPFQSPETITINNGVPGIDENRATLPVTNYKAVTALLNTESVKGFSIVERMKIDEDINAGDAEVSNRQVHADPDRPLTHAAFVPGINCFELVTGHHDARTDIFCLGLVLGSAVMGLDLYDTQDLNQFASYRVQPAALNARMHPTICSLVTEMTELDRSQRTPDLHEVIQRLKYYRDYDPLLQADLGKLAGFKEKKPADRNQFILAKLRNRLFDTTRRNRLLYYKSNSRFVNLTVSSVPMVLHYQAINVQNLVTWNDQISSMVIKQQDISLNKYLRFEDHPYLNAQLNGIRQDAESDKKEYGFSQLKLVLAFLNWNNLKEDLNERIQSPLLLLPVELERRKALREEHYTIRINENVPIINPILANFLKDLYGIILPESIDFDEVSMQQFFTMLQAQITGAKQGVKLTYVDKPRIRIIHNIARQTINNYRRRVRTRSSNAGAMPEYSYSRENYKPLGLELFRRYVELKPGNLSYLFDDDPKPASPSRLADPVKTKDTFELSDGDNNPYNWEFDVCNIVLGNFNYKKMSLVRDYNAVAEYEVDHPVFNELFSNKPRMVPEQQVVNDPAEWFHVINADPTQARAVLYSRTGKSYIIQGPPGTGKSQTITNLVADFLAQGKTILFVCEKRAALDVVYHRLQQNKLSELCCYIHDSQSDKKEFIRDLRIVYEDFLKNKMNAESIAGKRKAILEKLLQGIDTLRRYHDEQQKVYPEAGIETRGLIERIVQLGGSIPVEADAGKVVPGYNNWLSFGNTIDALSKALEESGAEAELAKHPFNNIAAGIVQAENPFLLIDNLVAQAKAAIDQLNTVIAQRNIPARHAAALDYIKNLVLDSVVLEPLALTSNLELVDAGTKQAKKFEKTYRQYKKLQDSYQDKLEMNKRWINKFDPGEASQAFDLAQKQEKSFFSFLNGRWRRLKKQLNESYDFAAHQLKPEFSSVLQNLTSEYEVLAQLKKHTEDLQAEYGIDNPDTVYVGIEVLRRKQGDAEIDYLLAHPDANNLVLQLSKLNNLFYQLESNLKQCLHNYEGKSLAVLKDELDTLQLNAGALKELLPYLRAFADLPGDVQKLLRELPLNPVQAEMVMASQTLQLLYDRNRVFRSVNKETIRQAVSQVETSYKELLIANSEYIRARRRQKFNLNYDLSNTSVTTLNPEQREQKKVYTEGRRILEHEMGKSMRYKSIRELASNQSGVVLKDIKPVWLMSPLSVSDSLPLDDNFFDVVIFDEASQITLEEGVPALFRAPQTIIVGDDKQMPPSNFFNAKGEDPGDLEVFEGESEEDILSTQSDSLLVQGSRKLGSTMLSWHYRSRYETLISFSNHAFYEAGLLSIPDKAVHHSEKPLLEVNAAEDGAVNAIKLQEDSISYHYLPKAVYESRSNISEANYIAQMLRELLIKEATESIGIVAFSQEQQGVIEDAIAALAAGDKRFEELLEKAYDRRDEGQFTGLFVKNLENVQGDERDIIIMSVCYGFDSHGKMLMNFGPINKKGGEKRLNVIFSRAKKHMAVVAGIRHHNITNDHNDGATYFKRFLHYAEMVSTGNMQMAEIILGSLSAGSSLRDDATQKDRLISTSAVGIRIRDALVARGFIVSENVGQSSFKCSLAVKADPADREYRLGILIDDKDHYNNQDLVEQYYQRPEILRSFGWNIMQVFAKDWLEDSDHVLAGILKALNGRITEMPLQANLNPVLPQLPDEPVEQGAEIKKATSADGTRFIKVVRKGNELVITRGKTGTAGLSEKKTLLTENLAIAEQIRLVGGIG